jgi:glycosyltransferase involved in cell wall biosynthesis
MNDWHARMQRTQQLALAFAEMGCRCFYFNPHLGYEYCKPYPFDRQNRLGVLGARLVEVHVRLPTEHVFHSRLLTPAETGCVVEAVEHLRARCGIRQAVQIISLPIWTAAAKTVRERHGFPLVYDCHDHIAGFRTLGRDIVREERALLETCDLAVFSSAPLRDEIVARHTRLAGRSTLIRNAADVRHFSRAAREPRQQRRVAGYFGALEDWFDVESVEEAARSHPDCRFVLVGRPEHPALSRLTRIANLELAGEAPYQELPEWLARFDVAMIPFRINELTAATNPIKLYEYFGAGIPVVSTALPEVARYGGLVYVGDSPREFAACIGRALAEEDPLLQQRRKAVARSETWQVRTAELLPRLVALRSSAGTVPPPPARPPLSGRAHGAV